MWNASLRWVFRHFFLNFGSGHNRRTHYYEKVWKLALLVSHFVLTAAHVKILAVVKQSFMAVCAFGDARLIFVVVSHPLDYWFANIQTISFSFTPNCQCLYHSRLPALSTIISTKVPTLYAPFSPACWSSQKWSLATIVLSDWLDGLIGSPLSAHRVVPIRNLLHPHFPAWRYEGNKLNFSIFVPLFPTRLEFTKFIHRSLLLPTQATIACGHIPALTAIFTESPIWYCLIRRLVWLGWRRRKWLGGARDRSGW